MTFTLDHLAFTNGWRFKITDGDRLEDINTPFILQPGEKQNIHQLDLEGQGEDVFGGWFMGAVLTGDSEDLAVQAITDKPGPEGRRRSGIISAGELLSGGATEPRTSQPWAEQVTVDGTDVYSLWFEGFSGFGAPVRFPEFSRVEAHNVGDSPITVTAFRATSILIHKPELFFKQLAAYNAAQGQIDPRDVIDTQRGTALDDETLEDLVEIMSKETI